jgi:23S rRNA (cytosine1962-C5)-methyltransferase
LPPPVPPSDLPTLRLRRGEDRRLRAGHAWVFSNEVDTAATPLTALEPGSLVRVESDRGAVLGTASVNPATLIAARLLTHDPDTVVDSALLAARLRRALALRARLGDARFCRWVFGESDGVPGLVLDRYGDVVVGQIATLGMERLRPLVEAAIREVVEPATLLWKNDGGARALENLPEYVEAAWGAVPAELVVRERPSPGPPLEFRVPLAAAQKTGWFYDQADNRATLSRYLRGGERVLDVCSYAGGWAVTALAAGAREATCVDASRAALDVAAANAGRIGRELSLRHGDAFDTLAALAREGRRFEVVVLDPPAFSKRKRDLPQGEAAYRKLNQLALELVEDDGLLVTCSCSWHLAETALLGAVQAAARRSRRLVQVLRFGGQSADHPVHPAIPETRYLKALFCRTMLPC